MARNQRVSPAVIRRLPRYYRYLGVLLEEGCVRISSKDLAEKMRLTASQIRQDFNCFGGFGQQGYGYNVEILHSEIGKILGLEQDHPIVLIGAGHLGRAFASHMLFAAAGFRLVGVFDCDQARIGSKLTGYPISDVENVEDFCLTHHVTAAALCVPDEAAPSLVSRLHRAGVRAIWNLTTYDIAADYPDILVENVHLTDSLMSLCYLLNAKSNGEETPNELG